MSVDIAVGTNSYISAADASSYFNERLYAEAWGNSNADDQARALIAATKRIDRQMLRGKKAVPTQTLEFPRALYRDDPYGYGRDNAFIGNLAECVYESGWVMETAISSAVKEATCEEALAILSRGAEANQRAQLQSQGVKSFSLGSLSETYRTGASAERLISNEAIQLLQPYLAGGAVIT
jgi:hypothetical protein